MTFDISKIHSLPALKKPDSGLIFKRDRYWMIFYNEDRKSRQICLDTDNLKKAKFRQAEVYRLCEKHGCGPKTKMQLAAEEVLRKPASNRGIVHSVQFGGVKSPTFPTVVQARNFRNRVAKEIVERKSLTPAE